MVEYAFCEIKSIACYLLLHLSFPLKEQIERAAIARNCRGTNKEKEAKDRKKKQIYLCQFRTLVKRLRKGGKFITRKLLDSDNTSFVKEFNLLLFSDLMYESIY